MLRFDISIQQIAESVLAIIGLVRYFAKLTDDEDDATVDAEVEKDLERQDDALEAAGVDQSEMPVAVPPGEPGTPPGEEQAVQQGSGAVGQYSQGQGISWIRRE